MITVITVIRLRNHEENRHGVCDAQHGLELEVQAGWIFEKLKLKYFRSLNERIFPIVAIKQLADSFYTRFTTENSNFALIATCDKKLVYESRDLACFM